jgi:hypothetical protein
MTSQDREELAARLASLERASSVHDAELLILQKLEREAALERGKLDQREKSLVRAILIAAASPFIAGVFGLGAAILNNQPAPQPTTETVSVCTSAILNVRKAMDAGVRDPIILEKLNTEAVDAQCGEEADIARDILANENAPR